MYRSRPSRLLLLLPIAAIALSGCSVFRGDDTTAVDPGTGGGVAPAKPVEYAAGGGQGGGVAPGVAIPNDALPVTPEPGIIDPRPHAWDHIDVASDGRTLTIYYYGGVEECYGLGGVEVGRDAGGVLIITVFEGSRAPGDQVCIDIAMLKSTVVILDEPLVLSEG